MLSTQHDLSGLPDPQIDGQFYTGVAFKRLVAWFIDFIIIMLIASALVVVSLGIGAFAFPLLLFATNIGYRIFMLTRNSATLGMHIAGIEIRNGQGNKLTLEEASWHTCIYTLVAISVFILIISSIMMLINERGQGIHDYFVGTTAINRPRPS